MRKEFMSELIQIGQQDAVAHVALNRPEAYNAFNYELISQLADRLTALMENPALLKDMGRKARGIARPGAADEIVNRLMEIGKF